MPFFKYHPALLERYPNLVGGVLWAENLHNRPTPPEVIALYFSEQRRVYEEMKDRSPSEVPSLAAWRGAFRAFGVEPTQYRSAAEALLRRLVKKGDIPSINLLVDLYNLVSIRYRVPMAAFDLRGLTGDLTVRFADGSERFTAHDEPEAEHPQAGEVIFVDDTGLIFARRWCWKQSLESATVSDTTSALITIEAHHPTTQADVAAAINDISSLLQEHASARVRSAVLSPGGQTAFELGKQTS